MSAYKIQYADIECAVKNWLETARSRLTSLVQWWSCVYCMWRSNHSQHIILVESHDFCISHLHLTPPLGGFPLEYCHNVWRGKTRMMDLPDGEKILTIRDRWTDGHTLHSGIGCTASWGKN